jgi:hypothetical protein
MAKLYRQYFETWHEWLDHCSQSKEGTSQVYWQGFHGTKTFAEAINLATHGWPEGEAKIQKYTNLLVDKVGGLMEVENPIYDVHGVSVDVGKFCSNDPECWLSFETQIIDAPIPKLLTLTFNAVASGEIAHNIFITKGTLVCALVELLEMAGYSVAVNFNCHDTDKKTAIISPIVRVKKHGMPLDRGRLAFALAHPDSLRRLTFAHMEQMPQNVKDSFGIHENGPYGNVEEMSQDDPDRGDIYIAGSYLLDSQWSKPETAEKWLIGQLEAQGIKLQKEGL